MEHTPITDGRTSGERFGLQGLMVVCLFVAYVVFGGVWTSADIWPALRGIVLLWLPCGWLLYELLRGECRDICETLTLSAVGSMAITTGLALACDLLALQWPVARWGLSVICGGMLTGACFMFARRIQRDGWARRHVFPTEVNWKLLAVLLASLCATARYQRAIEPASGSDSRNRFVLHGDQMYFTALAAELQRSNPPQQSAVRAGTPERAYHNLSHLTLALIDSSSGNNNLLRSNLVFGYTILVLVCTLLMYCLAREVGGSPSAGLMGAWLVFLGAIPTPPVLAKPPLHLFYFTFWPHSSSTIEPTLMTSPQMFAGITVALAVLLGLVRIEKSLREGRPYFKVTLLVAVLTALLMRFRLHGFIVLAPLVSASLIILAWKYRRWSIPGAVALMGLLVVLQLAEMRMPSYLATSQRIVVGNNKIGTGVPFLSAWPGSALTHQVLVALLGESELFQWVWQFTVLSAFCVLNIVGAVGALLIVFLVVSQSNNERRRIIALAIVAVGVTTLVTSATLGMSYDSYSIGGQIPSQLGWFALPIAAAALWKVLDQYVVRRFHRLRTLEILFWVSTLLTAGWQSVRDPGYAQSAIRKLGTPISTDLQATCDYCRSNLPHDAVLLSQKLWINIPIWSGWACRRTYVDYLPANWIVDELYPPSESTVVRVGRVAEIHRTENSEQLAALLLATPATHLIEFQKNPLKVRDLKILKFIWSSPQREITIWEIQRGQ